MFRKRIVLFMTLVMCAAVFFAGCGKREDPIAEPVEEEQPEACEYTFVNNYRL